jgi:hypothetical protein
MMELLNDHWKEITLRDYVCSNCWGHLLAYPMDERLWLVVCHRCGDETKGYVTKYFADGRREESHGERHEAKQMLESMGIIQREHSGKSEDELIKELGF